MVDLTLKSENFITAFTNAVLQLQATNIELTDIFNQWNAMAYATGANPTSNNITDTIAQAVRPSLDALILNQAMGAIAAVQTTLAANEGYLEAMRP